MRDSRYRVASICWAIVILLLLLSPSSGEKIIDIPHVDKAVHFGLFVILGVLVSAGWQNYFKRHSIIFLLLPCILFAGASEYLQMFAPGRNADVVDFIFDLLGIFSGFIVTKRIIIDY